MRVPVNLVDMHCHLDFASNIVELVQAAMQSGVGAFINTCAPSDYLSCTQKLAAAFPAQPDTEDTSAIPDSRPDAPDSPDIPDSGLTTPGSAFRIGLGLHPWWLADGTCGEKDIALFEELAHDAPYIGEIGIDFGPRRAGFEDMLCAAFERLVSAASGGGKVFSLHAARATTAILDVLEHHKLPDDNICIIHWFSGTQEELARAMRMGCYVSMGTHTLPYRRGRAYVNATPADRLLLETDLPEDDSDIVEPAHWLDDLHRAYELLEEIAGPERAEIATRTSKAILTI